MAHSRSYEQLFNKNILRILSEKKSLLDIGGGLRIDASRNNRLNASRRWVMEEIRSRNVQYKVLDYVDTYKPDIVGDIQDLPLPDNSEEAITCIAVLEHVPNPFAAAKEMYRVLKPNGYCLIYVPFLYYYHAEQGYYQDYWRYTKDSLQLLFKDFTTFELSTTRGALETIIHLSPFGKYKLITDFAYILDKFFKKDKSLQTSGYYLFLIK